jgi:hypothetical protein
VAITIHPILIKPLSRFYYDLGFIGRALKMFFREVIAMEK